MRNAVVTAMIIALVCAAGIDLHAQKSSSAGKIAVAPLTNDAYDAISINAIVMHVSNNGSFCSRSTNGAPGFEWPKGSGRTLIYDDGLVYGGKIRGEVRVGGSTYFDGWQAGALDSAGRPTDPADPAQRIYKIRTLDRVGYSALSAAEQQRLRKDFIEWPVALGLRYIDANRNGAYDPDFDAWLNDSSASDRPVYLGDEFLCFFSNDMDSARTARMSGTAPMGLEILSMVWAFATPDTLQNTVFLKHVMVNKGADTLKDFFIARWSDIDIGSWWDDYFGVDTTRDLAFGYNSTPLDESYPHPPAVGIRLLQGPVRPQEGATATFGFGKREGMENLPITGYMYFSDFGQNEDPEPGVPRGAQQMYNYFQSILRNGSHLTDPRHEAGDAFRRLRRSRDADGVAPRRRSVERLQDQSVEHRSRRHAAGRHAGSGVRIHRRAAFPHPGEHYGDARHVGYRAARVRQ